MLNKLMLKFYLLDSGKGKWFNENEELFEQVK